MRHRRFNNGGFPLDQNIYQAVKGMTAAEATNKEGGVIIMVAGCQDGHGGEGFYRNLADVKDPKDFLDQAINTPRLETVPDQWTFSNLSAYPSAPPCNFLYLTS